MARNILTVGATALILALSSLDSSAQENQAFDLVSMGNGDTYTGKIVLERFDIDTPYGKISVPLQQAREVHIGNARSIVSLDTTFGDRFRGLLRQSELTIVRGLDPPLPLAIRDISSIRIGPKASRTGKLIASDTVETAGGDLFSARVATGELLIKTPSGLSLISLDDLHILEIALSGDRLTAQATLNSGVIQQGTPLTATILVHNRYGDRLTIPIRELRSMGIGVNFKGDESPRFNYRMQVPQAALFQDRMRDGSLGPEMVALRGGNFTRGDLQGGGDSDEHPPQDIRLAPFAIGVYEVTFEEYDRFAKTTNDERPEDEGWGRERRPVINVSWDQAKKYTEWLTRQTGESYRLPTDAEWEYAARAGSKTQFWWGNQTDVAKANCAGCGSLWDSEKSSPVGRFPANPFGLHDTAGNVFEWVIDCWSNSFAEAPRDGAPYLRPECGVRVIRGGAWSFPPAESRSANRWRNFQSRRSDDTGFRVVRLLPPR